MRRGGVRHKGSTLGSPAFCRAVSPPKAQCYNTAEKEVTQEKLTKQLFKTDAEGTP